MAILCPEFGTDLGKAWGEAAAVVGQYMRHTKGKSVSGFTQERDGACLGFVVLDGKMDRARALLRQRGVVNHQHRRRPADHPVGLSRQHRP